MSLFAVLVLVTALATILALVSGISAMVAGHQVGHLDSAHWMLRRVEFQAVAILVLLFAVYLTR